MRIGYFNARVFLEGIEITDMVNKYSLNISKNSPSLLQLFTPKTDGIKELLPGTLVHIFFNDPADPIDRFKWFFLYEGALIKKAQFRTASSKGAILYFKGTSKILDDCRYSSWGSEGQSLGTSFLPDLLYVNSAISGKPDDLQMVMSNPAHVDVGTNATSLVDQEKNNSVNNMTNWKNTVSSFSELMQRFLNLMGKDNPYFKIIDNSLKFVSQIKIYGNDNMIATFLQIKALETIRNNIVSAAGLETYRTFINSVLKFSFLEYLTYGIPSSINNTPVQQLMVPSLEFTSPPIFNIIFPDEFGDYNLNINYENEPTRTMVSAPVSGIMHGFYGGAGIIPTFFAPSQYLKITPITQSDGTKTYSVKFTDEEKYRGVNAVEMTSSDFEYGFTRMTTPMTGEISSTYDNNLSISDVTHIDRDKNTQNYMKILQYITDYDFYKRRLSARGIGTITVNYFNPSWMIGFPGMLFTKDYGPIMVNFDSMTLTGDSVGDCKSTLNVSAPRFTSKNTNEIVKMDLAQPDWYNNDFEKVNIGKNFYGQFAKNKRPASITDVFPSIQKAVTNSITDGSIEASAKALYDSFYAGKNPLTVESRKRQFIEADQYLSFLQVKLVGGFPDKSVTEYRDSSKLDAQVIITDAGNADDLKYLDCPFVLIRGNAVLTWLGLDYKLKLFANNPPPAPKSDAVVTGSTTTGTSVITKTVLSGAVSTTERGVHLSDEAPPSDQIMLTPVNNGYVDSGFGYRLSTRSYHKGIDIVSNTDTNVYAAFDGKVAFTKDNSVTAGNYMVISHPTFKDGTYSTRYLDLKNILYPEGQYVSQGTLIATMWPGARVIAGKQISSGTHLHFEVLRNGVPQDPLQFLPH